MRLLSKSQLFFLILIFISSFTAAYLVSAVTYAPNLTLSPITIVFSTSSNNVYENPLAITYETGANNIYENPLSILFSTDSHNLQETLSAISSANVHPVAYVYYYSPAPAKPNSEVNITGSWWDDTPPLKNLTICIYAPDGSLVVNNDSVISLPSPSLTEANWYYTFTPTQEGWYKIWLYVTDQDGSSSSAEFPLLVTSQSLPTFLHYRVINVTGDRPDGYQLFVNLTNFTLTGADPNATWFFVEYEGHRVPLPDWIDKWSGNLAGDPKEFFVRVLRWCDKIYVYYGTSPTISPVSGSAVFDFFDDFGDGALDTGKWNASLTTPYNNYVQENNGIFAVNGDLSAGEKSGYYWIGGAAAIDTAVEDGVTVGWLGRGIRSSRLFNLSSGLIVEARVNMSYSAGGAPYRGINVGLSLAVDKDNRVDMYYHWDASANQGGTGLAYIEEIGGTRSGGTLLNLAPVTGTHMLRLVKDTGDDYAFYLDESSITVTASLPQSARIAIFACARGVGDQVDARFDFVRVRKYADPEPTISVGIENNLSTIFMSMKNITYVYQYNGTYIMNITVKSSSFGTVLANLSNTNVTVSSYDSINTTARMYHYILRNLPAGTYLIKAYANNSAGEWASSQAYLVIQKAQPNMSIRASASQPWFNVTVGGVENNDGDSDISYKIYINGTLASNPLHTQLHSGIYNVTFVSSGGENYTSYSIQTIINVTKAWNQTTIQTNQSVFCDLNESAVPVRAYLQSFVPPDKVVMNQQASATFNYVVSYLADKYGLPATFTVTISAPKGWKGSKTITVSSNTTANVTALSVPCYMSRQIEKSDFNYTFEVTVNSTVAQETPIWIDITQTVNSWVVPASSYDMSLNDLLNALRYSIDDRNTSLSLSTEGGYYIVVPTNFSHSSLDVGTHTVMIYWSPPSSGGTGGGGGSGGGSGGSTGGTGSGGGTTSGTSQTSGTYGTSSTSRTAFLLFFGVGMWYGLPLAPLVAFLILIGVGFLLWKKERPLLGLLAFSIAGILFYCLLMNPLIIIIKTNIKLIATAALLGLAAFLWRKNKKAAILIALGALFLLLS